MAIHIKTPEDIKLLRKGGAILGVILDELEKEVVAGNTTLDVDDRAMELVEEYGVEPMILGYHPQFAARPYPAATCVSIDDEVVHGIPNETPKTFVEGEVVSIDCVIAYEGMIVDSARTVICGNDEQDAEELLEVTRKAVEAGIKAAKPGARVSAIGKAIEAVVPEGYGIVEDFCGHGVGYELHEEPLVPNFVQKGESPELLEGMVIAIEPMIIKGDKDVIIDPRDGYTVLSADGGLAAHMEHTVLITKKGAEALTRGAKK
jgi:methionyl aminopeptidase